MTIALSRNNLEFARFYKPHINASSASLFICLPLVVLSNGGANIRKLGSTDEKRRKVFQKDFSAENPKIICANGIKKHHLRRKYFNKLRNYWNFYTFAQKISSSWKRNLSEEALNTRHLQTISPQKVRNLSLCMAVGVSGKPFLSEKPPMTDSPFS